MSNRAQIGIDPTFRPSNFGAQTMYVNGYLEELLLEMARYRGKEFVLMRANWDCLWEGLRKGEYKAILTNRSLSAQERDFYRFSMPILDTGLVLIVSEKAKKRSLESLVSDRVGILLESRASFLLEKHPTIVARSYVSIPDLLNAVVAEEVEAAILEKIPAVSYVQDLYAAELEIVLPPLTDEGIRLVGEKELIDSFQRTWDSLQKKKKTQKLLAKWNLEVE